MRKEAYSPLLNKENYHNIPLKYFIDILNQTDCTYAFEKNREMKKATLDVFVKEYGKGGNTKISSLLVASKRGTLQRWLTVRGHKTTIIHLNYPRFNKITEQLLERYTNEPSNFIVLDILERIRNHTTGLPIIWNEERITEYTNYLKNIKL